MKTVRQESFGKITLRLVEAGSGYKVVTISKGKVTSVLEGAESDDIWKKAASQIGRLSPDFWGYDDARLRFLSNFPMAFEDVGYIDSERAYKDVAANFVRQHIPIEVARKATSEHCEFANKAFAKTNMVTPIEKTRIQALLRSSKGSAYLAATAELAEGNATVALSKLDKLMREHGQPSWPCATYLPLFWRPGTSMFLKPQITKEFASRVGHSFVRDYDARLNGETYASLLDLANECEREIVALQPQDRVDVQSLIWVVGAYPDARVERAMTNEV